MLEYLQALYWVLSCYVTNRKFFLNNFQPIFVNVNVGMAQGSTLGPTLLAHP